MKTHTLFLLNLIVSALYLLIYPVLSGFIHAIVLLLVVLLFFYTSQKIRDLNRNIFLVSRLIIQGACVFLIGTLFRDYTNAFAYRFLLLLVILGTEAYELLIKYRKQAV